MSHYGSKEAFVEYHESRGRTIPGTWDNDFIESALLVASEWLDGAYGNYFSGYQTGGYLQERQWPRTGAYTNTCPIYNFPTDEIPKEVEYATYEAAFRQASNPGSLSVDFTPGKYKSVRVEGAISVDYAQFTSSSDIQTQIGVIDRILWPILSSSANGPFSSLSGDVVRV